MELSSPISCWELVWIATLDVRESQHRLGGYGMEVIYSRTDQDFDWVAGDRRGGL